MSVVIETTLGDITVDLFIEERPQTCLNFLKLCKIKYYNLCLFHSVTENFLAQTGDPSGKGDGGESIYGLINGRSCRLYQAEKLPRIKHDQAGLLSMVSHGNGLLGSQFIITLNNDNISLDQEHCVFGQIVEGEELLQKLNEVITDSSHRPYQDIRITHTIILDDPFPDPDGLNVPPSSPVPPSTRDAAYSRIPADEPLSENYSQEELDEMVQEREAAARATILEMVGDLPEADAAPPENVLFVCKLNPVTTDHDLSIIFSRFGTVKSCEVIRDQITGDSLQYAFVEFEDKKACEDAYFKMDNVLIDDRRIHVDFSQSVAKLKWRGKGKGVIHLDGPASKKKNEKNNVQNREVKREKGSVDRKEDFNNLRNDRRFPVDKKPPKNKNSFVKKRDAQREEQRLKKLHKLDRVIKKRKRRNVTSSSSVTSSDSSSTADSTDSDYNQKRKHSRKVLVVVKTPRRHKQKKKSKSRKKSKKYDSDSSSDTDNGRRKKRKKTKKESSDSSTEEEKSKRRKKVKRKERDFSSDTETKKRKKRKYSEDSSEETTGEEQELPRSKLKKRKQSTESSSDSYRPIKKRKAKQKLRDSKKSKKKYESSSETSSSSA